MLDGKDYCSLDTPFPFLVASLDGAVVFSYSPDLSHIYTLYLDIDNVLLSTFEPYLLNADDKFVSSTRKNNDFLKYEAVELFGDLKDIKL